MLTNNIIRQIFTQFFGLATGLATSIITARILGPEGRGEFTLLVNTVGLLNFVFGFSLGTSIIHFLSSRKMHERRLINSGFSLSLLFLGAFILISVFFPKKFYHLFLPDSSSNKFYLIILILLLAISLFTSFYSSVLTGKRAFKKMQMTVVVTSIISLVSYFMLYYYKRNEIDLMKFVIFYLLMYSLPLVGFYLIYYKSDRSAFSFSFLKPKQLKYLIGFSLMAYLSSILHFLSCRMDFWIVEYYNGSKYLGYYSLASNLSQMLWIIPQAIAGILISYASDDDREKSIKNTNLLTRVTLAVLTILATILFLIAGFIIPFLFGKEYNSSVEIFQLLLIGVVPFCITTIFASFFVGIGKIKTNVTTSFISFLLCLLLDVFLIPKYGVKGATIASVVAYLLSTIYIIFVYLLTTQSRIKEFLFIKKSDVSLILKKIGLGK